MLRRLLLGLGLGGTLLFGAAFLLSFVQPLLIEQAAREIVRIEVERRVGERIDSLSNSRIVLMAQKALGRTEADLQRTRWALKQDLPALVANRMADLLKADCECRRRLVEAARQSQQERVGSLEQLRDRLAGMIEGAYAQVTTQLMREFRIVTASNGVACLLLTLAALRRQASARQLLLPAVALLGAMAVVGGFYFFRQNWLHTLVFGQYVGLAYAAYLLGVTLLLVDLLLNRARVTNGLIGLVSPAAPC